MFDSVLNTPRQSFEYASGFLQYLNPLSTNPTKRQTRPFCDTGT